MKLILTNYPKQHKSLLEELAKVLKFKISKFKSDLSERDKLFFTAIKESKKSGILTKAAQQDFENSLFDSLNEL